MRKEIRLIEKRTIFVPMILSLGIFLTLGMILIDSVNQHYIEHVEDLSANLVEGYANSIALTYQAEETINHLLEEKLLLASEAIGVYTSVSTVQQLKQVATTLKVDEINIYDSGGKLLLTTMENVSEWQIPPDHPMHAFLSSDARSFVEAVRPNALTGILYKYGYYKLETGNIIQIGVDGAVVAEMLDEVTIFNQLLKMVETTEITQASFVNEKNEIVYSSNSASIGNFLTDGVVMDAVLQGESIGYMDQHTSSEYQLYVPVFVHGNQIGTLHISHSMKEQAQAITAILISGGVLLLLFFALIAYVIVSNYDKNKKLFSSAYYDTLTKLPNSDFLHTQMAPIIDHDTSTTGLILINVNEFKKINMAYGYEAGDQCIQEIANRLRQLESEFIQLFRFNSDRFIVIIRQMDKEQSLKDEAKRICQIMSRSFIFGDVKKVLSAEMGGVILDHPTMTLSKAISKALLTIDYQASSGQCELIMYNQLIEAQVTKEELLVREMHEIIEGIQTERLFLLFQPQLNVKTQRVVGVEALARLHSNHFGLVSPVEFIALAEKHHLIYDLGKILLRLAAKMSTTLEAAGLHQLRMAVNISGIQLVHDGFEQDISDLVSSQCILASNLELEITESILMNDMHETNSMLESLHQLGVVISLDDFGTGYSSFFRLSELHVDFLKIDRSFVQQISNLSVDKLITSEIIQMAHKYDLQVIAEGVENHIEFEYLTSSGCDIIQGYFFSWPLPKEDLVEFIEQYNKQSNG